MEFISLNIPRPDRIKMDGNSTLASPSADLVQALLGFPAAAGKPVTKTTATRVAAFLSAAKMLAQDIAKMPLILRETSVDANGRQRTQPAIENPLYALLKDVPNDWHTSYQLRFFLAFQLITQGNCFCQKVLLGGDVIALNPLDAWNMTPHWDRTTNPPQLLWRHTDGNGNVREFKQGDLWHVTNTNIEGNGVAGTTVIALAKEALSVLMAAEETAGRNFANGLGMGGFISFPAETELDEKQAQGVVDTLKKNFSGSQNAGKFSVIPGGGKWEKMTFNAQESQLLESRKWNEQEVVRLLGGAPLLVKLGLGEQNSTYASSSAFLDEYFNTCLLPHTTAIEQSITRDLIPRKDWGRVYAKHSADIILRGSPTERATTNKLLIESGQLTFNEARLLEDRDYVEGGDVLTLAANSCIFDIGEQEWFIPGQAVPEASEGTTPAAPTSAQEPDAAGSGESSTAPPAKTKPKAEAFLPTLQHIQSAVPPGTYDPRHLKPLENKAETRLLAIANALAERVMRKEAKGGIDAKFVAEVLSISKDKADEYVAKRSSRSDAEARAALIALAQGE